MMVRQLRREDMLDAARIRAISFHGTMDEEERARGIEKMSEEQIRMDWGCFDDDGTLMAVIMNNDFTVRFDGRMVKMGGIGGVATLPEYRYGGAVRAIFGPLLRAARENGEVISALYPFSHEFYRKVGYEQFLPLVEYEFPPSLLSGYRHTGWTKRVKSKEEIAPMKEIYGAFAARYNLMLDRVDGRYPVGEPFRHENFTMLLGDERGARAYLYYRTDRKNGENILNVVDIAFLDQDGLRMCLGYMGRMSADYGSVKLVLPEDVPLLSLVPRPYEVGIRFRNQPMARLTNAQRALEIMKKPEDAAFTVKVEDPFLPENSGTYRVAGDTAVLTDEKADVEVSGQALTLMALGTISLEQAMYRADVKVHGNIETLRQVFVRKPMFISDYF